MQLGAGVVSAGGYYYLQRTSPDTIKKVEAKVEQGKAKAEQKLEQGKAKVEEKFEQGKAKATQLGGAATAATSGTPNATNGALDPSKFTTFKLKAVEVGLLDICAVTTKQADTVRYVLPVTAVQPQHVAIRL